MKCNTNNILYIFIILLFIYIIGNDVYKYFRTETHINGSSASKSVIELDLEKPEDFKRFESLIKQHSDDPLISSLMTKDAPNKSDLRKLQEAVHVVTNLESNDDQEIDTLHRQIKSLEERLSKKTLEPVKSVTNDDSRILNKIKLIEQRMNEASDDNQLLQMEEQLKLAQNELKEARDASNDEETNFLREQLNLVVDKIGSLEEVIKEQNVQLPPPKADEDSEDELEELELEELELEEPEEELEEPEEPEEESDTIFDQIKSIHVYQKGEMPGALPDNLKNVVFESLRELKGPASNPTCYGEYGKDCTDYEDTGAAWLTFASGVDVTNHHVSIYNDKKYSNVSQCLNDLKKEGLYPDYVGIRKGAGQTSAYENTCYYYNDTDGTDYTLTPFENTADKSYTFMKKVPTVKSSLLWWKELLEKIDPALLESDISNLGLVFKYKNGLSQTINVGQPLVLDTNPINEIRKMVDNNKNQFLSQFKLLSDSIKATNDTLNTSFKSIDTQFNTKLDSVNTQLNTKLDGFESNLERFGKNVMKELQPPRTNPPSEQDLYTKQFGGITSVNSDYMLNNINNVKYVMLQMQRDDILQVAHIGFYGASRQRIQEVDSSIGHMGAYSSPWDNSSGWGIRKSHDGDLNTTGASQKLKCVYFMYELPSSPALDFMRITNRRDCCQDRLEGTAIILLNKDYIPLKQLIISKSNWSNSNSWVGVGLTREYNIKEFVDFDDNNACLQTIKTLQDQVKHDYEKVDGSWLNGQNHVDIPDKKYSSIHECIHELKSEGKRPDYVGLRTTWHESMPSTCYYYENVENPNFAPLDGQHTLMRNTNKKAIGNVSTSKKKAIGNVSKAVTKAIKSIF